ncbi:hypothetical protein [Streptomyces populi]|nr:hypothetical protein [Streptomyces populi]
MSSLLGAAAGFRSAESDANPRSVVPGRRRRYVGPVPGRPPTPEVPATGLRRVPGGTGTRAVLATGGVLVRPDASAGARGETVLDEASSDDETETEAAGRRTLRVLAVGRTPPITAHRLPEVRHADRIHVIDKGVAGQETHDELLARRGLPTSLRQPRAGEPAA